MRMYSLIDLNTYLQVHIGAIVKINSWDSL